MTDREKAIVMARTGICMLAGEKFSIFHQYVEELMGRPVQTIELAALANEIKKRADSDFIELCKSEPCEDCISRQAAIDLADELKDDLPDDDRLSDMVMSHNEGILEYQTKLSLLPSVQPKQTDVPDTNAGESDCISRQYLVERATSWDKHFADSERYVSLTDIQNAPSVTPAEKVGHWIEKEDPFGDIFYNCSACGESWATIDGNPWDYGMEFCPNCGAKMEVADAV